MASEQEGLLQQKEILIKKLNFLRKELAIASDAGVKFTLKMQIAEVEKEIQVIDSKLTASIPSENQLNSSMKEENPYDSWIKTLKKSWIIGVILLIFLLVTKGDEFFTAFDNLRNRWFKDSKDTTIVQTDTSTTVGDKPTIATPVSKESPPKLTISPKKQASVKKTIPITLIINAEFDNAEISINGNRIYPSAGSTPTFKKLTIEYNVTGYEVVLKTAQKTCKHQFSIAANELNNPITIPVSCTN